MTIHSKLSILMGEKKYNISDVHDKTGLSRTTISNLYHDKMERIDYETLNKLCRLFNCGVERVLEFKEESESTDNINY